MGKAMMRICGGLLAVALLGGCANSGTGPVPPKTAEDVDLQRYQGTWYELARLPMFFQRACAQSQAEYALQDNGKMSVTNRCRTREGEWKEARGEAEPQKPGETDKLWVHFDNWFGNTLPGLAKGDYWILYVDDDYRTALVGSPDRDYLWLLSRTPTVEPEVRAKLLEFASGQDFDTDKLIWRSGDAEIGKR